MDSLWSPEMLECRIFQVSVLSLTGPSALGQLSTHSTEVRELCKTVKPPPGEGGGCTNPSPNQEAVCSWYLLGEGTQFPPAEHHWVGISTTRQGRPHAQRWLANAKQTPCYFVWHFCVLLSGIYLIVLKEWEHAVGWAGRWGRSERIWRRGKNKTKI